MRLIHSRLSRPRTLVRSAHTQRRHLTHKVNDPLRILYCGSDAISCAVLRALAKAKDAQTVPIKSIDVVCRPDKPVGRGLKTLAAVPIKACAKTHGFAVHQLDKWTGGLGQFAMPEHDGERINLIIAASFGLMVPTQSIEEAKYGGLNVHPSILPNFRGAAPLQHTILKGHTRYGVTIQTLSPGKFDGGVILDQTPWPGEALPNPDSILLEELIDRVCTLAPARLIQALQDKVYVPPITAVAYDQTIQSAMQKERDQKRVYFAPKLSNVDRQLGRQPWDALHVTRVYRALGKPWAFVRNRENTTVRVRFGDMQLIDRKDLPTESLVLKDEHVSESDCNFLELVAKEDNTGSAYKVAFESEEDGSVLFDQYPPKSGRSEARSKYVVKVNKIILAGAQKSLPASQICERLSCSSQQT